MSSSLPSEYFDKLYEDNPDPWDFKNSDYEAAKYARTVTVLNRSCYESALEIGCSIGILTRMLASRCNQLLAIDVSQKALDQARQRNADLEHVKFELRSIPASFPDADFDLIVLSEVAYYWSKKDREETARLIHLHARSDGQLLLVHWLPFVPDYLATGDEVHEYFLNLPQWRCISSHRETKYRIELLQKRD